MNLCRKGTGTDNLSFVKSERYLREEETKCGRFSLANFNHAIFEARSLFHLNSQLWIKLLGWQEANFFAFLADPIFILKFDVHLCSQFSEQ